jgi:hypothetical protein
MRRSRPGIGKVEFWQSSAGAVKSSLCFRRGPGNLQNHECPGRTEPGFGNQAAFELGSRLGVSQQIWLSAVLSG